MSLGQIDAQSSERDIYVFKCVTREQQERISEFEKEQQKYLIVTQNLSVARKQNRTLKEKLEDTVKKQEFDIVCRRNTYLDEELKVGEN